MKLKLGLFMQILAMIKKSLILITIQLSQTAGIAIKELFGLKPKMYSIFERIVVSIKKAKKGCE